jgi:hypothetical protein
VDGQFEVRDFAEGVQKALEGDEIPSNALSKAWNTAFRSIGSGKAVIGTRPGLDTINDTPLSGNPAIVKLAAYSHDTGSGIEHYGAVVGDDGKLYYKQDDDTLSAVLTPPANFPFASGLAFTAGSFQVDAAVMNNSLFLVADNGERRSLIGTTYEPFGLEPIATVAVAAAATGSASMPAETYDIAVTTYDDDCGEESSSSTPASVTLAAGERIKIDITPTAAESAQYPYWRVYLRRQTTQASLYRVLVLENAAGANVVTDGNIPIGTLTVYVDLSAAAIANHVLEAPTTVENDPPPTTVKHCEVYGNRLILADNRNIYWSNLGKPRGFNPENTDPIEDGSGSEITGLKKFSDELLLIFTTGATFALVGNDPQTWSLRPLNTSIGCSGHLSVVDYAERIAWWSPQHGPVEFNGQGIRQIGDELLGVEALQAEVEPGRLQWVCAAQMPEGDRIKWGFTETNGTRNTKAIVYNYRLERWESDCWDGIDPAALGTLHDTDGLPKLYLGSYNGQLFKYNPETRNDGVVSGTTSVEWTPAASSTTVIEGTGFYNTNGRLTERKVTIVDNSGRPVARARISSNTATELTVTPAVSGLAAGSTYTVYVGAPDVRIYSKWFDFDTPFQRKRVDRLYIHARSDTENANPRIATQLNFLDNLETISELSESSGGSAWDAALWDSAVWAGTSSPKRRISVLRTCNALRVAILHPHAEKDFILLKISGLARILDERIF